MILSELLGLPVRDHDGHGVGYVADVRLLLGAGAGPGARSDGPGAARVHGLLVTRRQRTPFLGFERAGARGPWLVAALVARLHRDTFLVHWADVQVVDDRVVLRAGAPRWSPDLPGD